MYVSVNSVKNNLEFKMYICVSQTRESLDRSLLWLYSFYRLQSKYGEERGGGGGQSLHLICPFALFADEILWILLSSRKYDVFLILFKEVLRYILLLWFIMFPAYRHLTIQYMYIHEKWFDSARKVIRLNQWSMEWHLKAFWYK